MSPIIIVTLPFFALVLCGYLAAQRRVLPESAIPGLNAFVLYFALPAMLLRFGMNTPVLELLNPVILGLYVVGAGVMVATAVLLGLAQGIHLKDSAFGALVAAFPNAGFMGVPLLVGLLGPGAAAPVICTILVDIFVTTSACIALAQAHDLHGKVKLTQQIRSSLLTPLGNPLPWAIALGALLSATQTRLPTVLDSIVRMMAEAASPVALFTIGAVLWRSGAHAQRRTSWRLVWPVAALKLLLHPALIAGLCLLVNHWGAQLSHAAITALVLCAALPSASNVSVLAERYGADNGRITRIILLSTVLAFLSFTVLAALFDVQPPN